MRFILPILLVITLISCNNDDDDTSISQEEAVADVGFFNLRLGNTWTYEYFRREQNNEQSDFITTGTIEEREIIGRSVVDDEVIYTFQVTTSFGENDFFSEFDDELVTFQVKDSLGYLIRINDRIRFSSESSEGYLISSQNFGDVFGVLLETPETIETPIGTFDCSVNEIFAVFPNGDLSPGRDTILNADGIGTILERLSFVSTPFHFVERRLISFDFPE